MLLKIEKNAHTQRQEIHIKKVNDEEGVNEEKLNISNILQWLVWMKNQRIIDIERYS